MLDWREMFWGTVWKLLTHLIASVRVRVVCSRDAGLSRRRAASVDVGPQTMFFGQRPMTDYGTHQNTVSSIWIRYSTGSQMNDFTAHIQVKSLHPSHVAFYRGARLQAGDSSSTKLHLSSKDFMLCDSWIESVRCTHRRWRKHVDSMLLIELEYCDKVFPAKQRANPLH